MILEFQKKHMSIAEFSRTELPAFTVITGVNGSGKSHLLEAIENQSIKISDIAQPRIVRFNYETFRLENEAIFTAHQLAAEREQAWQFHQQQVRNQAHSWRTQLGESYNTLKKECIDENRPFWKTVDSRLEEYKTKLKVFFCQPNQKNNQHAQGIYSLAKKVPFALDDIEHDDFLTLYKPYTFKNDFLPNQLGKVFWDYYVKLRQNQINEFENEKYGKNYPFVSEDEFIRANGDKPWQVVNQILQQFDTMTYRVNSPEGTDVFTNFKLKLCHTQKPGLEIEFSSLSSGEKILMALVASVYTNSKPGYSTLFGSITTFTMLEETSDQVWRPLD